jgi:iron complex outermembrane receptor protein
MRHAPATFGLLLLAAAVSASVHAQQAASPSPEPAEESEQAQATDLDAVIVTGSRSPKAIDRIPGAVTLINAEEVQRTLSLTEDATAVLARSVPGYSESSQALNNLGETLRGRVALRLFDGIPQGSPLREGSRSGTFTDMGVIGRIEVINGPSAAEGIGGAGGVINYISKSPSVEGTETTLTSRYSTQMEDDSESWKVGLTVAHKGGRFDLLGAAAFVDRGITYDGNGRRIGISASGSVADSEADNLFLKVGMNFGAEEQQRLQFSASRFNIESNADYRYQAGNRATGLTDTAIPLPPLGGKADFNDFEQYVLAYSHGDLLGGAFQLDLYRASQAMRFPTDNSPDRQDPLIAPIGSLIDQSEINSEKKGAKAAMTWSSLFGADGLELRAGLDVVEDEAQQRLALTDRVWVPPLQYKSKAPWLQLSWDFGALTLSGGFRREDGELTVDDYTTTFFRDRRFVNGGTVDYQENLVNFGAIYRLPAGFSVFASYGEGFSLPNAGIPLRNIQCTNDSPDGTQPDGCPNDPPISVADIVDLQAIVVENKEVGLNWRGERASFGASVYRSYSEFGSSYLVDPVSLDFILNRAPVEIEGFEANGEFRLSDAWKFNALYSRIEGKSTYVTGGPLDRELGINDLSPDKLSAAIDWKFSPRGNVVLGATMLFDRDINEGRGNEEYTEGYTLLDLNVNYDFERYGKLSLGVENLTDKFYLLTFSQIDFFQNYFAGRGRVISLTHTITF